MPQETVDASAFSPDILDFLRALHTHKVKYMIVGGEAVIFYGHIRVTGDIGIFFDKDHNNAAELYSALYDFWEGDVPGLEESSELEKQGVVFQFGVLPNRIDLLNDIDGVDFRSAWENRAPVRLASQTDQVPISYIGLKDLVRNKRASGRPKDVEDLPFLLAALE